MLDCLVCSEPFHSKKSTNSKSETSRRKRCFHYFCQLLGLSPEQSESFSLEYDFSKEIPFCVKCHKFATDLTKHGESRETLEEDIVSLQLSICDKLRDVSEATIQIDKIVRQVRGLVKNPLRFLRSKGRNVGDVEDEDDKDLRGVEIRNLIIQLTPEEEIKPRKERIRSVRKPKRERKAKKRSTSELIQSFPESFFIPDSMNLTIAKVEIKDEPIDADFEDTEAWNWASSVTAPANVEDAMEEGISGEVNPLSPTSVNEDDYDSLCILPEAQADTHILIDELEGIDRQSGVDNKLKKRYEWKRSRKTKHVVKHWENSDSDCDYGGDDHRDKDYVDEEELEKQKPRTSKIKNKPKSRTSKIKDKPKQNPRPTGASRLRPKTLKCIEYLGEIDTSDENKWTFKGVEVIKDSDNYKCGRCGEIISKSQDRINLWASINIRKHIQEKHFGGYKCNVCSKEGYTSFQGYFKHSKKHLQPPVYCGVCEKPFKRNSLFFRAHVWSHNSEAEKEEAIKTGFKPPNVPQHTKPYILNYQCTQCGKCFMGPKALKNHEVIHKDKAERDKEKLPCPVCGKMLVSCYLDTHIKYFHENKKPAPTHACKICSRYFITPSLLQRHTRQKHTFEKPYMCNICSKSFVQQAALTKHKATHSDARPFACSFCSATFKHKNNLVRHVRSSHVSSVSTPVVAKLPPLVAELTPEVAPPIVNYDQYNLFSL